MNMQTITDHHTNECNRALEVLADKCDEKNGNASHRYLILWKLADGNSCETELVFQRGPIKEVGVNGITNEVLLTIIIDRLRGFQSGPYACRENAIALTKLEEAFHWLEARTRAREARGVEGTHAV